MARTRKWLSVQLWVLRKVSQGSSLIRGHKPAMRRDMTAAWFVVQRMALDSRRLSEAFLVKGEMT